MNEDSADYSQWTIDEIRAAFSYHNESPEIWAQISQTFDIAELERWKNFNSRQKPIRWRGYAYTWIQNRIMLLLAIVFGTAVIASPAALVGQNFGWIGGAFLLIGTLFVFWLIATHPDLKEASARFLVTEQTRWENYKLLETSTAMLKTRIEQLKRWRELR